ncbi:hypothetical protein Pst134EA_019508 [Puccinia striiformis f. sp. tritici]|uniref:hypothetical protein n=1 Tax=Puccinia striiformis f. sp. tritici TaxID=168172 RepID=UPI00200839E6|nr:hypothetical protein Pst134EA_019508 [Puccinia striiformis f. sp. tritici]KAH9449576.1 hypothetical protein Pst134EB_020396 [Puccinia striiformis f. sp. tritici]KAH9459356.1 hypothetical protein Pst134EA_019508 [Puccinia striiformis f. sp. tritici]KAI9610610.1 hypothetical protein H4Q26_006756 [Puccinia striiformis f. sp. tritici PST-130]KAI9618763.1 hypothetical protein KEM48_006528 [Puccinia striiformis f. sp. tritici PST-130]
MPAAPCLQTKTYYFRILDWKRATELCGVDVGGLPCEEPHEDTHTIHMSNGISDILLPDQNDGDDHPFHLDSRFPAHPSVPQP